MPSITPVLENQRKKLATDHNLENVLWPQTVTTQSLTPLERRWFGFFIAVAKLGYVGIQTSIGKLSNEEYRVNGQTHSERTTYRALALLENKNIIIRKKFRKGSDKFSTIIYFNLEAFSFYLQRRSRKVVPLPTGTYYSTHLPRGQEEDLTSINGCLTPKCSSKLVKQQDTYQKKIAGYLLPLLITVRVICQGARSIAIRRTETELSTGNYVSGVDWDYWSERWPEFNHARRDATAEREILPALLSPSYGRKTRQSCDVDALVAAFVKPTPKSEPRKEVEKPLPVEHSPDLLSVEERAILEQALQRVQARQRAG